MRINSYSCNDKPLKISCDITKDVTSTSNYLFAFTLTLKPNPNSDLSPKPEF